MKYFISYAYLTKDNELGIGNAEVEWENIKSFDAIEELSEKLTRMDDFKSVAIISWQPFKEELIDRD